MKISSLSLPVFIVIVVLIGFGTFWVGKNATKQQTVEIMDCQSAGTNHVIEIKNDKFIPEYIDAKICDELTIVNKDDKLRLVAFGVHDQHIYYNGITEKPLKIDGSLSVTLNQLGVYIVHDHLQEEVQAEFKVQ